MSRPSAPKANSGVAPDVQGHPARAQEATPARAQREGAAMPMARSQLLPLPWKLHLTVLAIALAYPFLFPSSFMLNFGVLALFYAFIGQSWNISGGFAGQLSFGHVAFFGIGAYASTIAQLRFGFSPWLGLPVAALAGALIGGIIGVLSFRAGLKGSYFALITLAFAEVLRIVSNSVGITGGGLGMLIPMKPGAANLQFAERSGFYFLILVLVVISIALAEWLRRSRFGAQLAAIRENEDAAKALGINVFREKVKVMLLSGAIGGVGGSFFAQYFLYIDPLIAFGVDKSVEMLLVTMIGGAGTVYGPMVGALLLALVSDGTRALTQIQGLSLVLYGALLVIIIAFLPNGLIDLFSRIKARFSRGRN
ncbi:MAG: branched-chain amino acid ABC transporter permease [Rhodoferax sp.]|nr:branched-chain amino acid ABC transporter permease [Rhodoferax sp.]MBP9930664.1 branched-chain amino acid ABC transporter permease [Rhodoferax sp.]HQX59532.1 branched-chain amino acid ABC transporter permease [Burkholderiaceae bacterium]HQZ07701.1 branched-chain amino acid ABC transporter permease [Burkholderiaceae bacterium]HRA61738.1 branched-chain amino acid ABC transporter permease [Burkholderiaceae bacterium]